MHQIFGENFASSARQKKHDFTVQFTYLIICNWKKRSFPHARKLPFEPALGEQNLVFEVVAGEKYRLERPLKNVAF